MQARDPSPDKRGSAKRRSPSASLKGSASGAGGIGVIGSCTAVSSRAGSRFSGAAPTVTAMTNSNTRHPATISRLRKGGFNARGTSDNAVSPVSCIHRIPDLETGSSDVGQRSVINQRPSRVDTAYFPSTVHPRPQLAEKRGEQAHPPAPVRGLGQIAAIGGLTALVRAKVGRATRSVVEAGEHLIFPIVGNQDGSGDRVAEPLTFKQHRSLLQLVLIGEIVPTACYRGVSLLEEKATIETRSGGAARPAA